MADTPDVIYSSIKNLGKHIKSLRRARQETAAHVGRLCGTSAVSLQTFENGTRVPNPPIFTNILAYFDLDTNQGLEALYRYRSRMLRRKLGLK